MERNISPKFKLTIPVIMFAVLVAHVVILNFQKLPRFSINDFRFRDPIKLTVRPVKTQAVNHPNIKAIDSVINTNSVRAVKSQGPKKGASVDLKDLGIAKSDVPVEKIGRPGSIPDTFKKSDRAINKLSLTSKQFRDETGKGFPSGGLSISDMMSGAQKISDALVSIEVPDGVEPDQLNEYELMFYGFKKRTGINYVNSIMKSLDKFQKVHPRYKIPVSGRITMTARVNYDKDGNVIQIKMIRWTHVDELQNLFEDIVKNIDQLHNPPKMLWEKNNNEFAMFYTLEILNG